MPPSKPEPAASGGEHKPRTCQYCGQPFQTPRPDARYCSIPCLIARQRAQTPLEPEACYQQTAPQSPRPDSRQYEIDSTIPYTLHRPLPTARELAQAREQKALQTRFDSAPHLIPLGLWQDDLGLSVRLIGPWPAAPIETGDATHPQYIVYWQGQYRIVSVEEEPMTGRKVPGGWCLYETAQAETSRAHQYHLTAQDSAPELPTDIKALRRIIQKNHPDKGGHRTLYEAAKKKLDEIRDSNNPP